MTRKVPVFILAILMANAVQAAPNEDAVKVNWGYKGNIGPIHWGELSPAFGLCNTGKSQSPINIPNKVTPVTGNLAIAYQPASPGIIDHGSTTLTIGKEQSVFSSGHSIQLNFSGRVKETIRIDGTDYRLLQFHLHSPSETQWHGQTYPMEIHFVHQSDDGKAAVLAVFVKVGAANPELQKFIPYMPSEEGKENILNSVQINPSGLLPEQKAYYRFDGSLTTPPCTEGLQWLVLETPITATPAQINIIRNSAGGDNARPVQPLNGRQVRYAGTHQQ